MKTIVISADGSGIEAIYDDSLPLHSIGDTKMERASNVVWDQRVQMWRVDLAKRFKEKHMHSRWFEKRQDAIDFEIKHLNKIL